MIVLQALTAVIFIALWALLISATIYAVKDILKRRAAADDYPSEYGDGEF